MSIRSATADLARGPRDTTSSAAPRPNDLNAQRLDNLLAVLPAGVVVLDGAGVIQDCNTAAVDLLDEPLKGQRWIDIIDRAFNPQAGDGHDVSLHDGRLVNIATSPLDNEPGQIILLHDVTENRQLHRQVSHLQRLSAMGEMAARLAHQIRTPLSSAMLNLSPLVKQSGDVSVRRRFARRLQDSLTHMEQLVKNMLTFSRGDMSSTAPVNVENLLQEVASQFQASPDAENYHLEVHNRAADAHVYGSQTALASAIYNLLNNAREACGDVGEITLFAELVRDDNQTTWLEICVEDNGIGIPEHKRDNILKPFYTTRATGTGLGLAVVQSVARAHKGQLWFDSQAGEGSTFSLQLPLYRSQTNVSQEASHD